MELRNIFNLSARMLCYHGNVTYQQSFVQFLSPYCVEIYYVLYLKQDSEVLIWI